MRSILAPHTHVRASVFNVFDAHFSNKSLKSYLFSVYFYLLSEFLRCCCHNALLWAAFLDLTDRLPL